MWESCLYGSARGRKTTVVWKRYRGTAAKAGGNRENKHLPVALGGSCLLESDIDIAIMISKPVDGLERVRLETNLSNVMGKDVDLVIFGRVSPLLQHQILRYGRLVYEANPKERVRQETTARRQYLESLFLYRIIDKDKAHGG